MSAGARPPPVRWRARVPLVTRRGWAALGGAGAAILLTLLTLNPLLLAITAGAFGFVGGAILLYEFRLAGVRPGDFVARRLEASRRVPVGTDAASRLEVTYRGRYGFWAEVIDLLPDAFELRAGSPRLNTYWAPGATLVVATAFRPTVRGAYLLGPTLVTIGDAFGFCARQLMLPSALPVTALPELIRPSSGRMSVGLFTARSGSLPLPRPGSGSEFRSLRPYQSSDDIRHVAWKRSTPNQLMVREFHLENRQDLLILLDLSPGMRAGGWGTSALDLAVGAATMIASLVSRQAEDRIGLLTYVGGVFQYIPPSRGPRNHQRLIENLALLSTHEGPFDLPDALLKAAQRLETHAHILAFGTPSGPTASLRPVVESLRAHGHRLYVFLADLSELYAPPSTPLEHVALDGPRGDAKAQLLSFVDVLHRQGIPVFHYGLEGARQPALRVYGNIKSVEGAR